VDRLDRSTVIGLAVTLALGFALWQLLSSVGYLATRLLTDIWEDGEFFTSHFSIGGVRVEYGQTLASIVTLLIAVLVAVPLLRYARDGDASRP